MKILIINWQDIKNPFGGGAEVHMHEIFRLVAAAGHDVTIFSCMFDGAAENEEIDGIKIIRKGSRNLFNFTVKKMYKTRFSHENYDIIIDDINKIPFYTPRYVKEPLLAISHHFFGKSIFKEAGLISGLYVYASEYLVNSVYKDTPFAVVSQSTLDEFKERGFDTKRFSIIQNAITQESYPMKIGEKTKHPTVVYFGRLKKYKSPDHLVKAFAIISKIVRDAELHFVGKGNFQPELEKLCKQLGVFDKTVFHGFVSDEKKVELLSQSYCAVNTSIKEGWGITNIEANACGTPVISSDVPGLRDSIKKDVSGQLYEYGNIEELAGLIYTMLTDNSHRRRLSEGALTWAKSFTWKESAELMIKKCEEVIAEQGKNQ